MADLSPQASSREDGAIRRALNVSRGFAGPASELDDLRLFNAIDAWRDRAVAATLTEAIRVVEAEPELEGWPDPELLNELKGDLFTALRATVRATKKSILAGVRALLPKEASNG